jgi:tetratricopeptide (TPR) repeat protein
MDIQKTVIDILTSFEEGNKALEIGQYSSAWPHYTKAMQLLMNLPNSEPFDRLAFAASCLAGMALVNVHLQNYDAALQAADKALSFFDKGLPQDMPELTALGRKPTAVGELYPAEFGKWVLAVLSKGISLVESGRFAKAAHQRDRAREMLRGPLAQSAGTSRFQKRIIECVNRLEDLLRRSGCSKGPAWWKFWK